MKTIFQNVLVLVALMIMLSRLHAQSIQTTNFDGGSIVVNFGEVKVNTKSSLHHTWYVLNDISCPLQLNQTGIKIVWPNIDEFLYMANGTAKVTEKMQAIEIRYILFDVFGEHLDTLSWSEVEDIDVTDSYNLDQKGGKWRAPDSDVPSFLSSVAFVAQIRTSDGKIWRYNQKSVSDELLRIQLKAADIDLNPKKEK